MRNSTRDKLFDGLNEYIVLWNIDDLAIGSVSLLSVGGRVAIIHEYPDARNGFEVYTQAKGSTVADVRNELGLNPKGE